MCTDSLTKPIYAHFISSPVEVGRSRHFFGIKQSITFVPSTNMAASWAASKPLFAHPLTTIYTLLNTNNNNATHSTPTPHWCCTPNSKQKSHHSNQSPKTQADLYFGLILLTSTPTNKAWLSPLKTRDYTYGGLLFSTEALSTNTQTWYYSNDYFTLLAYWLIY